MKSSIKMLVLALVIVGMGVSAYAADVFTITDTQNEGLNGSAMAVTPSGSALANAAVPVGGPTDASSQAMMPNGGLVITNASSGLTTNFNQTGVANAFAYNAPGVGPFQFPAGSPGDRPQGSSSGGPVAGDTWSGGPCPTCPAFPAGAGLATIDQLVSKYTASNGFAQNFHDSFKQGTVTSPGSGGTTGVNKLTLEQGDTSFGDVFKSEVVGSNGAVPDNQIAQLNQSNVDGVGPFSVCMNCLQAVVGPVVFTQRTSDPSAFAADTVTHPGP